MGAEELAKEVKRRQEEGKVKGKVEENKQSADAAELEWLQLNQTLAHNRSVDDQGTGGSETTKEKFIRKLKENPLVPIGAAGTAGCLMMGLGKFARKDSSGSQTMMRGRIAAQGFTVFAMLVGVIVQIKKQVNNKV